MPAPRFGKRIRALRIRQGLTQAAFAERLGVSASYLNLIEHDRRGLTPALLIRLAQVFDVDLRTFAGGEEARLVADLAEVFGDPVFEAAPPTKQEIADFAATNPDVARSVLALHRAYVEARQSTEALAERVLDSQDVGGSDRVRLSSEQVSDLLQRHENHFPALEAEAERLWRDARLESDNLFRGLVRYLERAHGVSVRIATVREMRGAVRRFDAARRELLLSEVLRRGSRHFQVASQVGLLECGRAIEPIVDDPLLATEDSRTLARVALASYFAGAVLMPYADFLRAAEETRYDVELLGHRFRVGFEQTCHRLTTLRRPGAEGVSFYFVRVDIAGNISKKFSAAGIRFPRFSGLCALWNVHAAFQQPGVVRVQVSRLPDGTGFLAIARTVRRHAGGYHDPNVLYSVGIGCDLASAPRLIYSDGLDLGSTAAAVPIGVTCRLCERVHCQARAFPPVHVPLRIDENVRGVSFFAPVAEG